MTDIPESSPGQGPPPPPAWGYGPPPASGFTTRYGLVRPRQGRYLAGVCAAIARATNTDPVLWRVLLAVLGFFFGIGILVYVAAWLVIPAEGDTASPVEALLGKGRSSMSAVTVIVLSVAVVVLFGFIVTDAFRAVLLGAAILIGGALLLNRNNRPNAAGPPPGQPAPTGPPPGYPPPGAYPPPPGAAPMPPGAGPVPPGAVPVPPGAVPVPPGGDAGPSDRADDTAELDRREEPTVAAAAGEARASTAYVADRPGPAGPDPTLSYPTPPGPPMAGSAPPPYPPVPYIDPGPGGYRPPFAPHGPYGGPPLPPAPPKEKPPKPPKERSALGAATFSLIPVVIGLVAIADLLNLFKVQPSTYFAAILFVIALGLLVGTWLGRARWLIFLGLAMAAAVGIASIAETQIARDGADRGEVLWQPTTVAGLRPDYRMAFGDATLDLTNVDFTGQSRDVSVNVNFGELTVLLPPDVDVSARVDVDAGDARVFDERTGGFGEPALDVTDLGVDGPGGGNLRLLIHVNTGDVEVTR
jgi:phage shock protein PspC (stress-responsive transcriptional regulator)